MAIATGTAIALGATALASGASAAMGANASKKASNAAERSAAESAGLQREQYNQNANALAPYVNAGVPATQQINALLGLGGVSTLPGATSAATTPDYAAYVRSSPDLVQDFQKVAGKYGNDPNAFGQYHWNRFGQFEGRNLPTSGGAQAAAPQPAAATTQQAAEAAFDTFRNNTGYQFNLNEGLDAVRGGFSGGGTLQSGAALKALQQRGSSIADGTFYNYLGALGNQQGVGLSAASAQAGVGQGFANSMSQINANRADAQGNAALLNAQNTGNALQGLASTGAYLVGQNGRTNGGGVTMGTGVPMNLRGF